MNITLWIVQIILAAMFLMSGIRKSTKPIEELAGQLPWVTQVPIGLVRFIGISELLAGIGLILPALLRIMPKLTAYAALGLIAVMICAMGFHMSKGEYKAVAFNLVLGSIAAFIAWGRLKKAPISPK
ncbi:MAG: DoxX family protein [Bacteroidia bacterium]|nr:DoxX family protein [Bacteroidia bacterium]